jgi:hypothetical protein
MQQPEGRRLGTGDLALGLRLAIHQGTHPARLEPVVIKISF